MLELPRRLETAWCVWHGLMSPSFSLERWWWVFASDSTQGSMLSAHTWWGSLEKGCSHSLLWCPLERDWVSSLPSNSQCSHLDDPISALELSSSPNIKIRAVFGFFLLLLLNSFLNIFFNYYFLKKFPTSKIMICLPYCFTPTHPHSQGQGKTCFNTLCVELLGHC